MAEQPKTAWDDDIPTLADVISGGLGHCTSMSGGSFVVKYSPLPGRDLIYLLDGVEYDEWLRRRPPEAPAIELRRPRRGFRRA